MMGMGYGVGKMGFGKDAALHRPSVLPSSAHWHYSTNTPEVLTWHGEPIQLVEPPSFGQPLAVDLWPLRGHRPALFALWSVSRDNVGNTASMGEGSALSGHWLGIQSVRRPLMTLCAGALRTGLPPRFHLGQRWSSAVGTYEQQWCEKF